MGATADLKRAILDNTDLVAFWHLGLIDGLFDDFAEDLGPNKLHGSRQGGVALGDSASLVPGDRLARSTHFDGANDHLLVAHAAPLALVGDLSIVAALKTTGDYTSGVGYRGILHKEGADGTYPASYSYALNNPDGAPLLFIGDGTPGQLGYVFGTTTPPANTAALLAVTLAGATIAHYLNGAPNGSGEAASFGGWAGQRGDAGLPLRIGQRGDAGTRMLGELQFVALLDRALTADEMLSFARLGGFA